MDPPVDVSYGLCCLPPSSSPSLHAPPPNKNQTRSLAGVRSPKQSEKAGSLVGSLAGSLAGFSAGSLAGNRGQEKPDLNLLPADFVAGDEAVVVGDSRFESENDLWLDAEERNMDVELAAKMENDQVGNDARLRE